ncbi:S8 family serine peptidase [Lewinella sp. W8]|uniref:S8 family peptidase n=1 Tax=Lewinella sp. W8 TaxID=2528208 RepID=UPI0010681223|nr:S8 family serine peptidase [Lewinella sp. W8]MTB51139.1 S8 family serine peptidase [Lewinella sp. W8]
MNSYAKQSLVGLTLATLLIFSGCCQTEMTPAIGNELVVKLKDKVSRADVEEKDLYYLCYSPKGGKYSNQRIVKLEPDNPPRGEDIHCDTVTLGTKDLVRDINYLLLDHKDEPFQIKKVYIQRDCDCDPGLLLIYFDPPPGMDINSGVAGSRSRAKNQNTGVIGAIGANYNLNFGPINPPNAPIVSDECGVIIPQKDITKDAAIDFWKEIAQNQRGCVPEVIIPQDRTRDNIVKVSIIDTGIDYLYQFDASAPSHEPTKHFYGNLIGNNSPGSIIFSDDSGGGFTGFDPCHDFFGYDAISHDNNPIDRNGHGTHIAGTVLSGNQPNSYGIRVSAQQMGDYYGDITNDEFRCDLFSALCGIRFAVRQKANIINMSWGYYAKEPDSLLEAHLRMAADAGILMVASAGNDSTDVDCCNHWPSGFSEMFTKNMISVAALDGPGNTQVLASYSNHGNVVDLAAPGTNIKSALAGSGSNTVELSGTSMAAAVISRRAAMLFPQQGWSASAVKDAILNECSTSSQIDTKNHKYYDPGAEPTLKAAIGYQP